MEDGVVLCGACAWGETGEPWDIASAAAKARPQKGASSTDAASRRYDHAARPVAPLPIFTLAGYTISTPGNISVLQAKMKAGKSAAVGAMLAAPMAQGGADTLWFGSSNDAGKALLHFDTEQSVYDHHNSVWRSITRAGCTAPPAWLHSYHLKGLRIADAKAMIVEIIDRAAQECGGVHSASIDGIADLCADVNDSAESIALVAWAEELATKYDCAVWCVLHENHSSVDGKTRGHLGSQLARKAETNLRLEKNAEGVTLMWADTSRSLYIPKKNALGFAWNENTHRHERVETNGTAIAVAKKERELAALAADIVSLTGGGVLTWKAAMAAIIKSPTQQAKGACSDKTAERQLRALVQFSLLTKDQNGHYHTKQPSTVNSPPNDRQ